jgi:hypothetical protein
MWKIIVQPGRPQMMIWRMRIANWMTKATDTHSEYVGLIAFPLQQWLHECASTLRHTYIAPLVNLQGRQKYLARIARSLVTISTRPERVFFNFSTILSGSRNNFMGLHNTDSHNLGKSIKSSIIFVITCTNIVAMSAS